MAYKKCNKETGATTVFLRLLKKEAFQQYRKDIARYALETMKEVGF